MAWIFRLVMVTIILMVAQSFIFKRFGLYGVACSRCFSSRYSHVGDEILLSEEIVNNRPFPLPLLIVESRIDKNLELSSDVETVRNDCNYHRSVFSMMPFSKVVRRHKVKLLKRGYYDLKSIALSSYDLFGFIKVAQDEAPVNAVITVYPDFLDREIFELPSHSFLGDWVVKRWIVDDPFLNAGVRDYQSTDPMKNINWKATARTGSIKVNAHDFTANTKLMILFNTDLSEGQWGSVIDTSLLERGLSLCATYAKLAIENSIDAALASNAQSIKKKGVYAETSFGSGEQHLYAILEELALLSLEHVTSFHYFLGEFLKKGISQADILIITAYIDQEISDQVSLLRAAGNSVEFFDLKEVKALGEH